MSINRKTFLQQLGVAAAALSLPNISSATEGRALPVINTDGDDEEFWKSIRQQYDVPDDLINLNNGSVGPQSIPVMEAYIKKYKFANKAPSFNIWRKLNKQRRPIKERLAASIGASPDEVAICRNTTEALNNIIFGFPLKKGDEVVLSNCDYPFAMNAWRQREARDGIVLRWVNLDLPEENDEAITAKFAEAINEKTRMVHVTYIINWTGQILPVRKIADVAHSAGAQVLVDAAHAYAQLKHTVDEIGADYYATSLHKWLGAPYGTGFLYVKQPLISGIWPLQSSYQHDSEEIGKLEHLGTRDVAAEMTIEDALDFRELIGMEKVQQRLRYLKQYWFNQVIELEKVHPWTTDDPEKSCALASIAIKGKTSDEISKHLMTTERIHIGYVHWDENEGVRITPHLYTSTEDLDKLVEQIKVLAA